MLRRRAWQRQHVRSTLLQVDSGRLWRAHDDGLPVAIQWTRIQQNTRPPSHRKNQCRAQSRISTSLSGSSPFPSSSSPPRARKASPSTCSMQNAAAGSRCVLSARYTALCLGKRQSEGSRPVGRNNSVRPSGCMLIHMVQAPKHRPTNDPACWVGLGRRSRSARSPLAQPPMGTPRIEVGHVFVQDAL
jgi:hypothetical protein